MLISQVILTIFFNFHFEVLNIPKQIYIGIKLGNNKSYILLLLVLCSNNLKQKINFPNLNNMYVLAKLI